MRGHKIRLSLTVVVERIVECLAVGPMRAVGTKGAVCLHLRGTTTEHGQANIRREGAQSSCRLHQAWRPKGCAVHNGDEIRTCPSVTKRIPPAILTWMHSKRGGQGQKLFYFWDFFCRGTHFCGGHEAEN